MPKQNDKEAESFLKVIKPILDGYPADMVNKFEDYVKHPKDTKSASKVELMMGVVKSALKLRADAFEDGIITETEKKWLIASKEAVLSQINPIMMEVDKQIKQEEQKKAENAKKSEAKKSFAQKILSFFKNSKTIAAISAIVPATSMAAENKADVLENKPNITLRYTPQSFDDALQTVTANVIKDKEQATVPSDNTANKNVDFAKIKEKMGSGIEK